MNKIAIIVPNWNGADKLRRNLPNVLKAAEHSKVAEVIVTDDASTDNSIEVLKKEFPEIKLVKRDQNGGFSSNVNFGVSQTDADLIVLMNSDASPSQNFLNTVLPHFANSKVFSVGCNTGGNWARADFKNGFFWHSQASKKATIAHSTLWVSGGSGIFRRSIWEDLSGLDTLFDPFYEEDLDLGYRAIKRGYINLWEPNSKVEHYHQGVTSGDGDKEEGVIAQNFSKSVISQVAQRNQLIFIWKNITSKKLFSEHKKALLEMLITHPKYWPIFLSAIVKFPEIQKRRKIEQKQSILSDEQVLEMFRE